MQKFDTFTAFLKSMSIPGDNFLAEAKKLTAEDRATLYCWAREQGINVPEPRVTL